MAFSFRFFDSFKSLKPFARKNNPNLTIVAESFWEVHINDGHVGRIEFNDNRQPALSPPQFLFNLLFSAISVDIRTDDNLKRKIKNLQ